MPANDSDSLQDRIYEAAFVPDLWPSVLDGLAATVNAVGAVLFTTDLNQASAWIASEPVRQDMAEWVAEGWQARNQRTQRMVRLRHPGFVTTLDVFSAHELDTDAEHRDFLRPRGLGMSSGTFIPMPSGDIVVYSIEQREGTAALSASEVARLDALRPHLARAGAVAARLGLERARTATEAFAAIRLPAAALADGGQLLVANQHFEALVPTTFQDRVARLALSSERADRLLAEALATGGQTAGRPVYSIPVPASQHFAPAVVHLLPVKRNARDIFARVGWMCVVVPVVPSEIPGAEVLQGLFDLTVAEARVARWIGEGGTIDRLAAALGISRETVRVQLKAVFAKTGTARQAELARLLVATRDFGTKR